MSRFYLSTSILAQLEATLSPRDRAILTTLSHLRLATGQQLQRLYFEGTSTRRTQQALASLVRRRILTRLDRQVGGIRAGSAGFVYTLDVAGVRLVAPGTRRRARAWNVGLPFLKHTLAVSELHVRLVEAERAGTLVLRASTGEPACWRPFAGPHGRATLKPDRHLVIRLGDYEDEWFVEVDCGTESPSTLAGKCEQYRRYWQTGTEQARTGVFPRVLFLVPSAKRVDVLVDVFGQLPEAVWPLFTVVVFDEAVTRIARGADQ
jgi:hypothetical protein